MPKQKRYRLPVWELLPSPLAKTFPSIVKKHYVGIISSFLIFLIIFLFSKSKLIYSDMAAYALVIRYITEHGTLPTHFPYLPVEISNGAITEYYPLSYSPLIFLIEAVPYTFLGDIGIHLCSAFFAWALALSVYFLTYEVFGKNISLIAPWIIFAHIFIFERYANVGMVDQPVAVLFILSLYFYYKVLRRWRVRYAVYSGLAFGLMLATKQTAVILFGGFLIHSVLYLLWEITSRHNLILIKKQFGTLSLIYVIGAVVASPFLLYVIYATGTLDFPPGTIPIWFLKGKWTLDPESMSYYVTYIWSFTYKASLWEKLYRSFTYILYPLNQSFYYPVEQLRYALFFFLIPGIWYLFKKRQLLLSIVGTVVLLTSLSYGVLGHGYMYATASYIWVMITFLIGASYLRIFLTKVLSLIRSVSLRFCLSYDLSDKRRTVSYDLSLIRSLRTTDLRGITIIVIGLLFFSSIMNPFYLAEYTAYYEGGGRTTLTPSTIDRTVQYKLAGEWLREHTSPDARVLSGNVYDLAYYSKRNVVWFNPLGLSKVIDIMFSRDFQQTLRYLESYRIDYIAYDPYNIGESEFKPGLSSFLKAKDPHFQEVYRNEVLTIYKVVYDPGLPIPPTRLEPGLTYEVGSLLTDKTILFPNVRPLYLYPRERWEYASYVEDKNIVIYVAPWADSNQDGLLDEPIVGSIKGHTIRAVYILNPNTREWLPVEWQTQGENITFILKAAPYQQVSRWETCGIPGAKEGSNFIYAVNSFVLLRVIMYKFDHLKLSMSKITK